MRTVASIVEDVCRALWIRLVLMVMPELVSEMWLKSEKGLEMRWQAYRKQRGTVL